MYAARYFPRRYFPHRYFGVGGTAAPPPPPPPPTPEGAVYQLLIATIEQKPLYGWEVASVVNGQSTFRFDIQSLDGTYRPGLDEEVFLYEDTSLIFGGMITLPSERGLLDEGGTPIQTTVAARDFKALTQRRFVNETIPPGTLKAALQQIVAYLPGITLDPTQVDGPFLSELVYKYVKADAVLDQLTTFSGYVWDISFDRKLKMILPGSVAAPFNVTAVNSIVDGDITVEPTRDNYANRVIAKTSTLTSVADDAAEQAVRPIWEVVISAPDTTDQIALDSLAQAYLTHSVIVLKKIQYRTRVGGLAPGQTQTVVSPIRNLNNTFLIIEVKIRRIDGITYRYVTAVEGSIYQTDWRDVYRQWSGGGSKSTGGATGGVITSRRFALFLGGAGEAVRSTVPDWVPASGGGAIGQGAIHVQIDTDARGTTDAKITARLRTFDPTVTVQARLYDTSISAPVSGISAPVSGVFSAGAWQWQTVSWNVVLNPGAHLYELQLLPNTADADVQATATLE